MGYPIYYPDCDNKFWEGYEPDSNSVTPSHCSDVLRDFEDVIDVPNTRKMLIQLNTRDEVVNDTFYVARKSMEHVLINLRYAVRIDDDNVEFERGLYVNDKGEPQALIKYVWPARANETPIQHLSFQVRKDYKLAKELSELMTEKSKILNPATV